MPCKHKFYKDLNLNNLDYEPETLIVGTFNPEWPANNTAQWFYGRTVDTCFWDVLPRLYGQDSLINATTDEWKQFCREHKIALTDIISSIDDADPANREHNKMLGGFSDKALVYNFDDFEFTNIVALLRKHTIIRNVYFTRGITEAFWRHLWNPVMHYCSQHGLHERRLISPDDSVAYQHTAYNHQNPDKPISRLEDYILMRWQQDWHK